MNHQLTIPLWLLSLSYLICCASSLTDGFYRNQYLTNTACVCLSLLFYLCLPEGVPKCLAMGRIREELRILMIMSSVHPYKGYLEINTSDVLGLDAQHSS